MYRIITLPIFMVFFLCSIHAQLVETTDFDTTGVNDVESHILDQASVGFSGSSPNITLKTYKLSALIGKGTWDLYLYNSVPAYSIDRSDSITNLGGDILNQLGGLFNVSLSKTGYFANGGNKAIKDIKGGQVDFRLGGKVLDSQNRFSSDGYDFMVPVLQSTIDVRYLIPLVNPADRKKKLNSDLKKSLLGNLSFRVYGGVMQVMKSEAYDRYFEDERGNAPSHTLFTGNVEFNIFLTDQFFISAGYSVSNEKQMPNRSFFSISYLN